MEGKSIPEIARLLNVSSNTAITYKRQVYGKIEVHNSNELMQRLQRHNTAAT